MVLARNDDDDDGHMKQRIFSKQAEQNRMRNLVLYYGGKIASARV